MLFKHKHILFLLIVINIAISAKSQSVKELEQRKIKTQKEIEFSTNLLSLTEKQRIETVQQASLLKVQIELRKKLISEIDNQIKLLELEIENRGLLVGGLKQDLANLKKEYAKLIKFASRNRTNMQFLIFVFASKDFNQAYRRVRFFKQFLNFRQKQAQEIINTSKMIRNELKELDSSRKNLERISLQKTSEISNLNRKELTFASTVMDLQRKEKELRKDIEDRRKSMEALNKAILDLIAEEAKKAATKNEKVRDDRYLKLSESFSGNKGKLPWPTTQGIITSDFGEHDHPVLKGVKIRNNGIDITTNESEQIKAVFEGEVTKIVSIPGSNISIIIRHGDFLSVYSNLVKVYVKVGEIIPAQKVLGEVYNDIKTGKGTLNLQIWQENKIQNPKQWLLP